MDGVVFAMVILIAWKIQMIPTEEEKASIFKVLGDISSPIFALLTVVMLVWGIFFNCYSYYYIYIQEVLHADSSMIGKNEHYSRPVLGALSLWYS